MQMSVDRPTHIRRDSPCPECGGTSFESFAFAIGEMETPNGPRSFSRDLARCVACGARLRGENGNWTSIADGDFQRAVASHWELVDRIREQMQPPKTRGG